MSDFEDMWGADLSDYCLIRLPSLGEEEYAICHISNKSLVIIEDGETYFEVQRKMLEAGVRIVNSVSEIQDI